MIEGLMELKEAMTDISLLLFDRGTPMGSWIFLLVFFVAVSFVFKVISKIMTGHKGRSVLVLVPGFLFLLCGAAAVRAFYSGRPAYLIAGAAVAFFIIVIPLTRAVEDATYMGSVFVWAAVLLTAVAVFYIEDTAVGAVRKGAGEGASLRRNRVRVEEYLRGTEK